MGIWEYGDMEEGREGGRYGCVRAEGYMPGGGREAGAAGAKRIGEDGGGRMRWGGEDEVGRGGVGRECFERHIDGMGMVQAGMEW